jgi:hypothetical protein
VQPYYINLYSSIQPLEWSTKVCVSVHFGFAFHTHSVTKQSAFEDCVHSCPHTHTRLGRLHTAALQTYAVNVGMPCCAGEPGGRQDRVHPLCIGCVSVCVHASVCLSVPVCVHAFVHLSVHLSVFVCVSVCVHTVIESEILQIMVNKHSYAYTRLHLYGCISSCILKAFLLM